MSDKDEEVIDLWLSYELVCENTPECNLYRNVIYKKDGQRHVRKDKIGEITSSDQARQICHAFAEWQKPYNPKKE